jgi:hypothetical protein
VRNGAPNAAAVLRELDTLRARAITNVAVMVLTVPMELLKLPVQPVVVGGRELGPAGPEDLAYIGRQTGLSEEQVCGSRGLWRWWACGVGWGSKKGVPLRAARRASAPRRAAAPGAGLGAEQGPCRQATKRGAHR